MAPPALAPGEVHLWILPLPLSDEAPGRWDGTLSPDERERAERFAFAAPRTRFVAARVRLRRLLGSYLGAEPRSLRLDIGPHGKPSLAGGAPAFNLAHSGNLLLIAVAVGVEVGVDVERIREVAGAPSLARRWFTPREHAALDGTAAAFLRLWTCKEAAVKATGAGISAGWSRIEIEPGDEPRVSGLGRPCRLRVLEPAPGHVAAVAALGEGFRLRTFTSRVVARAAAAAGGSP